MNKDIIKGILLTLGVLSLFGVIFAVGFHTANEITSGTFSGDYSFTGNLNFTDAIVVGGGVNSMVTGFPDVVKCVHDDGRIWNFYFRNMLSEGEVNYIYPHITTDRYLRYNSDGTYNSQLNTDGFNCLGKSIQQLYDEGNAFNLVGGFSKTKIDCPTGFTSVESQERQLGCIQNDEEGSSTYYGASNTCWINYGGRLPSSQEWYLAMNYYDLLNEVNNWEWNADSYGSSGGTNRHGISGSGNIQQTSWAADSGTVAYRCFIPN